MGTKFTTLEDNYEADEWPDSRHTIRTLVEGDLADQVRARANRDGDVVIEEVGAEGGYSEFTVEWDWSIHVEVGGHLVWEDTWATVNVDYGREFPAPPPYSPLAGLLGWLDS